MRRRRRSVWAILALVAVGLAIVGQRHLVSREFVLDGVLYLTAAVGLFVAGTARRSDTTALWPHREVASKDIESVPLVGPLGRKILLTLVVAACAVAFVSLADNQFTLRGVLCWSAAVLVWVVASVHVQSDRLPLRVPNAARLLGMLRKEGVVVRCSWVVLVLLCILVVSFFFRVYRIDSLPPEAQSDHVQASEDVRSILAGDYMIFFPRNTGREAAQFYLTAALSHVFGYGFFTLKLTMALVGALNVIPMYFLGKELYDELFGLLAAFFVAISYWHTIVSRIGWRIAMAPFWTTVTLYFLLRAFRTGRRNDYLLTGLSLGMGLYGYMSFRVTPLLIIVLFLLKAAFDRGPDFRPQRFLRDFSSVVISSVLVFWPMVRYMYDDPDMYWYRVLTRTTNLERTVETSKIEIFVNNVKRALLMFNWEGDSNWTVAVPLRPILDRVSGALFVLGAGYLLYLLLVKRRPIALYLVVAVFVVLLPSTLSIAFPVENPSNIRTSGVIPLMIVMVALPVYLIGKQLVHALRGGTGMVLAVVLGASLFWQTTSLNFEAYFGDYYENYRNTAWNASDMAQVFRGFGKSMGSVQDAYYIGTAHWTDHRAVALMLGDMTWNNLIMDMAEAEPHLAEPRNRLYIFKDGNLEAEQWLLEHYPHGSLSRFEASIPNRDFMVYLAPAHW